MSKEIKLPVSKATVVLRDPKSLKQRDRKKVYVDGEVNLSTGLQMMENIIAILVESWTLDLLIPSLDVNVLGELELADYDVLDAEAKDAMSVLFPSLNKSAENEADPKALTDNSNG
jgi:hypothetical protein